MERKVRGTPSKNSPAPDIFSIFESYQALLANGQLLQEWGWEGFLALYQMPQGK